MIRLLKKEFSLCLHPAALIMLGLSALVLVPNYPPSISFFYLTLGIFFICTSGRENHDIAFTITLPVSRRQAVLGRILFACCLEMAQVALAGAFVAVKANLIGVTENLAGLDANLALVGEGFLLFGLFNRLFFPLWYRDVRKVGKPFLIASAAVFLYVVLAVVSTYAVPFVRDRLDTADPAFLGEKAAFLGGSALVYLALTAWAARVSVRRFSALDLQL